MTILQSVLDHHIFLYTKDLHTGLMVPSFLSLENPLSDAYTFIRIDPVNYVHVLQYAVSLRYCHSFSVI